MISGFPWSGETLKGLTVSQLGQASRGLSARGRTTGPFPSCYGFGARVPAPAPRQASRARSEDDTSELQGLGCSRRNGTCLENQSKLSCCWPLSCSCGCCHPISTSYYHSTAFSVLDSPCRVQQQSQGRASGVVHSFTRVSGLQHTVQHPAGCSYSYWAESKPFWVLQAQGFQSPQFWTKETAARA